MSALYLVGYHVHASCESRHLNITRDPDGECIKTRVPLSKIERVCLTGRPRVSMRSVEKLLECSIPVQIFSNNGQLTGSFAPQRDGDAEVRIRQYRAANTFQALEMARILIAVKIKNQRRFLQRKITAPAETAPDPLQELRQLAQKALQAENIDSLRGIEGIASHIYFKHISGCFPSETPFAGRSRRPPLNPANALLSWTYTLVGSEVRTALVSQGLDPCLGILHAIAYNRPALVLDLLEPFRAPLCDRLVLRLLNLRIFTSADFEPRGDEGGIFLKRTSLKKYFQHYEETLSKPIDAHGTTWRAEIKKTVQSYYANLKGGGTFAPYLMK
jgi:CRISPR-associated protein Cas1